MALAIAGAASLLAWLSYDPASDLVLHTPGLDGAPDTQRTGAAVRIGEFFARGEGVPAADAAGDWSRFRGPGFGNISRETISLTEEWPEEGPPVRWTVPVGEGHAGAAIRNGRVYVLDYNANAGRDALRCLSLDNGEELWRRSYAVDIQRNHGMSRTVPAVTDRHVVTLGPKCHVMCVDAKRGDMKWGIDLVRDYGTSVPMWYAGQCPLIDDGVAVLAPAGEDVLMMGVDCETGDVLWRTPNTHGLEMSHSSIAPAVLDGVRMYVYAALGGLVGVSAEGTQKGDVLWFAPEWDRSVIAPSPVVLDDGRIFVTAGYGGGSMMLRVGRGNDGAFHAEVVQTAASEEGLASEQQTPVLYEGLLYGVLPKDAGTQRNQLVCVRPDDIGTFLWTSGRTNRFGLGPYLIADDKLYVLSDDAELTVARIGSGGYRELDQARILDGHDAWAPMAIADGWLILRDNTRMVCVDMRETTTEPTTPERGQ